MSVSRGRCRFCCSNYCMHCSAVVGSCVAGSPVITCSTPRPVKVQSYAAYFGINEAVS